MAINLREASVESREQRLGTIVNWDGKASDLADQSGFSRGGCGARCGASGGTIPRICELESPFTQGTGCSEQIVENQASHVRDAVLIHHAPIGCSALHASTSASYRKGLAARGMPVADAISISTNLGDSDMVYGGVEKLRDAIHKAWERHRPKAIFIATSCATGIIGDDVGSAAKACEEEIGIPVIPVFCEGFKSNHWSFGFDAIQHGILRQIVRKAPRRKQEDLINLFVLSGADVYTDMLGQLGLRANFVVNLATVEGLEQMSEAAASTSFCYTFATYLGAALEREFGVPQIKAPQPFGFAGTDAWLRAIGRALNRQEQAEQYIRREHERIGPRVEKLRNELRGLKGFVVMGPGYAHGIIGILRELGITVEGSVAYHHDPIYDSPDTERDTLGFMLDTYGEIEHLSISNGQSYRFFNMLRRVDPDFIIFRHSALGSVINRLGLPVIPLEADASFPVGYQGIVNIGEEILAVLAQRKFHEDLAAHTTLPYKASWLAEQDPFALARQVGA